MRSLVPWPRSMFWRIFLVVGGGTLLIQVISIWYTMNSVRQFVFHSHAAPSARTIATSIRLLNAASAFDRNKLLPILANSSVSICLSDTEPHIPSVLSAEEKAFTTIFRHHLQQSLPPGTAFVTRVSGIYRGLRDSILDRIIPFISGNDEVHLFDFGYTVGVCLNDGAWIVFSHAIPASTNSLLAYPLFGFDFCVRIFSLALFILLAVRWLIRPLTVLAKAADKLGEDIHQPPLPETGPREIVRAAKAFNRMQARIRAFIDERGRMLAAVSHDLKTPITRMRLRADHIAAPDLQDQFVADLDEMSQMLDTSIEFVRSTDNGEGLAEVDIMALLESLADDYAELGSRVRVRGTAGAPLRAQPLHLKRCLTNLIDNGVRYGGEVDIEVRDAPAQLAIVIGDNGPGIPPELLDKVFEPFFRVENSRSRMTGGSGLGLSIARNIARLHGGDVVLANKPEGGLESRLTLPRTCAK